jgi:tetratricopeptide (TPR) repeat protein
MKIHFLCLGIIMTVLFSCVGGPGAINRIHKKTSQALYGMIYDGDNKPVKEVKIYVRDKFSAVSDIHGHFSLAKLKTGKTYPIRAYKENHEEVGLEIYYADPANVLYISMCHTDQLLSQAEQALRDKDWSQTASLLSRAEAAGGDHHSIQYLRGILALHRGEYDEALGILTTVAETEKNAPYLHLFIADLYQYYAQDKDRALIFLNKFLESRYEPEIAKRAQELEGRKFQ